jgi:hypothetical protein
MHRESATANEAGNLLERIESYIAAVTNAENAHATRHRTTEQPDRTGKR